MLKHTSTIIPMILLASLTAACGDSGGPQTPANSGSSTQSASTTSAGTNGANGTNGTNGLNGVAGTVNGLGLATPLLGGPLVATDGVVAGATGLLTPLGANGLPIVGSTPAIGVAVGKTQILPGGVAPNGILIASGSGSGTLGSAGLGGFVQNGALGNTLGSVGSTVGNTTGAFGIGR